VINRQAGLLPCGADLSPSGFDLSQSGFIAKRIYRHADLSPMAEKFSHRK